MVPPLAPLLLLAFAVVVMMAISLALVVRSFVAVPSGKVLLVRGRGRVTVSTVGRLVLPWVETAELVDVTAKPLVIRRPRGYRFRDGLRAWATAHVVLEPGSSAEDVARCAARVGAARVGDEAALRELFEARVDQAVAAVLGAVAYEDAVRERESIAAEIEKAIGDLDGWALGSVALTELEQVPLEQLDPHDALDAEAIRRLTERAAEASRPR